MDEKIAAHVIAKYLKKGNMARCLRDILPSAGLSKDQRKHISELVHDVVRWKKLYEHIIESKGLKSSPETYVNLAVEGAQAYASSYPFEYRYSCSPYVASVLNQYTDWAEYLNETPPTTLCVNLNLSTLSKVIETLSQENAPAEAALLETAIHTSSVSKYSSVIQQHLAHVQDENSQLIAKIAVSLGESLLDYCAGNGGKTLAMASFSKNSKKITAYEPNAEKRSTFRQRCTKYHASFTLKDTLPDELYDVVLVDAPCSGLGAARRNPEVKYIQGPCEFPTLQRSILQQAAGNVRKGGYLFYAVCTFTTEETSQIIEWFLKKHDFTMISIDSFPHAGFLQRHTHGFFTAIPRGDIFFGSVLKKK